MTTFDVLEGQMSLDDIIAERDREHQARRDITGEDPRADHDYETFINALWAATGPNRLISQNDVRVLLFEDTIDGPRCRIQHNRYSAFFARACKEGCIEVVLQPDGRPLKDICTTSPTGNNGKDQKVYRWLGVPR